MGRAGRASNALRHAALAWTLALAPALAQPPDQDAVLREAQSLLDEGQPREALLVFRDANRAAGGSCPDCLIGLARAYNRIGMFDPAIKNARLAIAAAALPNQRVQGYTELVLAELGKAGPENRQAPLREAEAALRELRGLGQVQDFSFYLGEILLRQGRGEEGRPLLSEFLESRPTGPNAWRARQLLERPHCASEACAPELELTTLAGQPLSLRDLRGRVVLIDFWATWCAPCVDSIPHLLELSRRKDMQALALIGISVDADEPALRAFVAEHGMGWPQVRDEKGKLARGAFDVRGYPTYVLIDHRGIERYRASGWGPNAGPTLDSAVRAALRAARKSPGD